MSSLARLSLSMVALLPCVAGAQRVARDTAMVAAVIVTATRSPLASERAPSSVSVLTGAQLRAEGITSVADALRQVPGLSLAQTGSYGGATSLFVRGGESKFTKVLIDGVPVNEAGGAFDFAGLSTDNIDRIEIVRGPASVLYGSDAMAGVVQLFTRRGSPGTHADLSVRGGTFGSYDADGSVRGGAPGLDYSLGGARHTTRGFQAFNSDNRSDVGSASVGLLRGAGDARLTLRYTDGAFHYPTDGSGQVVDSNAVRRESRLAAGVDAGLRFTPVAELRIALASNDVHGVSDNQPDSPGDSSDYYYTTAERSRRRSGDVRLNLDLAAATRVTIGGTIERQWQESGTTSNFGDTPTESRRRRSTGGYAQLLFAPLSGSTVTVGGRFEHNERFGDFTTWRAAASTAIASGTRLRGSVGTAFREPSFLENYGCCGFVRGNPDLSPEHAFSIDAGVEHDIAGLATVGATFFSNSFRDLIDYQSAAKGPDYVNIARTRARGVELDGRIALAAGVHADAAFTYLDARVVDPGSSRRATSLFAPDARLLRRPAQTLDLGIGRRVGRAGINVRVRHVGTREDVYFAPDFSASRVTLPAYSTAALSGDVTLVPSSSSAGAVIATARVDNLFDARYTDVAGVNYDFSGSSSPTTGYRAAPRRVLLGLRFDF